MLTVTLRKNESVDKAIRRLKKKVDREGVLKIVRQHAYYEKPSEKKLRKRKAARRTAARMMRIAARTPTPIIPTPGALAPDGTAVPAAII